LSPRLKALFISTITLSAALALAGMVVWAACRGEQCQGRQLRKKWAGRAAACTGPLRNLYSIWDIMDKLSTRKALVEARLNMPDRLVRADLLQRVMRIWLVGSPHEVIGAYWPIKGRVRSAACAVPLAGRRHFEPGFIVQSGAGGSGGDKRN
jgi:hypothetical protein